MANSILIILVAGLGGVVVALCLLVFGLVSSYSGEVQELHRLAAARLDAIDQLMEELSELEGLEDENEELRSQISRLMDGKKADNGNKASPIVFDDKGVQTPLLPGELI